MSVSQNNWILPKFIIYRTTAPVETPSENTSGGNIIYEPDSDDDFDDEDPDEDLYV